MQKGFRDVNSKIDNLEKDVKELKQGQQEIKVLVTDLDPRNANRHIEILGKIDGVSNKVELLRKDMNKVEVVTSQNSFEIQYLKAVK